MAEVEDLMTAQEVADLLRVDVSWVRRHTGDDELPHLRLGRQLRYRRESIATWVRDQERSVNA